MIDRARLIDVLNKKCNHRNVSYQFIDDFFTPELIKEANQNWQATLGNLINGLSECNRVLEETKELIYKNILRHTHKFQKN